MAPLSFSLPSLSRPLLPAKLSHSPLPSLSFAPPSRVSELITSPAPSPRSRLLSIFLRRFRHRPLPASSSDSPVIEFQEIVERDWSFLESDSVNSDAERTQKLNRIIEAAGVGDDSRVLVSLGGEDLVDRLIDASNCSLLLVVHYSLLVLALIKEKHDEKVRCWQGELVEVPQKWSPLDVVFIPHLPALNSSLDQILGALAGRCSSGARVVISQEQGREGVKRQKEEHPDVVISDLPDRNTLQKVAAYHSFQIYEFVDEPTFFLAVLKSPKT